MILGIDPKTDVVFKKLFGGASHVALPIDLLHAVVQPKRLITALDFVLPQSERAHPEDKETISDVKMRDQGGRQFQIEMQWVVRWFLPKRLLYYWGQHHPQQLRQGEHYMTLRPTITVCFLNQVLFADVADYHLKFQPRDAKHNVLLSEDMELHLIELPKFTKTVEQLTSPLDRWLYFLRHGADLDLDKLPASLDVPIIRQALEMLVMWTQEERDREVVAQRIKAKLDHDSLMADLRDEADRRVKEGVEAGHKEGHKAGHKEGHKEGHKAGLESGMLIGEIVAFCKVLKQPAPSIAELASLSHQELTDLVNKLQGRLSSNGHQGA